METEISENNAANAPMETENDENSKQLQVQPKDEELKKPSVSVLEDGQCPKPNAMQISMDAESAAASEEENIRRMRRKIKVAGAPKMPLNGYVRYMVERRELLRKEQPSKTAMEHTKIIGEEWNRLPQQQRAPYIEAAELDKQRYAAELQLFLKAHPEILAGELAKNKRPHSKSKTTSKHTNSNNKKHANDKTIEIHVKTPSTSPQETEQLKRKMSNASPVGITTTTTATTTTIITPATAIITRQIPDEFPIFTNDFVDHNKTCEVELRALRKCKVDVEQKITILEKHVSNIKTGIDKIGNENSALSRQNRVYAIYLERMKRKIVAAFADFGIPTEQEGATMQNIDKYISDLGKMSTTSPYELACLNKAKDIMRKIDFQKI